MTMIDGQGLRTVLRLVFKQQTHNHVPVCQSVILYVPIPSTPLKHCYGVNQYLANVNLKKSSM